MELNVNPTGYPPRHGFFDHRFIGSFETLSFLKDLSTARRISFAVNVQKYCTSRRHSDVGTLFYCLFPPADARIAMGALKNARFFSPTEPTTSFQPTSIYPAENWISIRLNKNPCRSRVAYHAL